MLDTVKLLIKALSKMDVLRVFAWYLGLKNIVEVKAGSSTLILGKDIERNEGVWRVKVLSLAQQLGVKIDIDYPLKRLRFYVNGTLFDEPNNHYGFLVLRYVLELYRHGARFKDNKAVLPNSIIFKYPREDPLALSIVHEVFVEQQWRFLNVHNKVVIDVGTYIGDSAIYFALRGVRKVICYEPHPILYRYLIENVKLNKFEDRIQVFNYAVASREGFVEIKIPEGNLLAGSRAVLTPHKGARYHLKVKAVKLPLEGDVLKMDCEGCEYDILLNINPRKLPFSEIGLEYHGSPKPLIKHLKQGGYRVKIMKRGRGIGIMYAFRR